MSDSLLPDFFETDWGKRLGLLVLFLLILLTLYTVIRIPLVWYADWRLAHAETKKMPLSQANTAQVEIMALPEKHLFGKITVSSTKNLPVTSLELRLVGVIHSDKAGQSRVIISSNGQPGKVYGVGDTLPSGVKIHDVTSNGIVLENGGQLEKLPLQRNALIFQGLPKKILNEE